MTIETTPNNFDAIVVGGSYAGMSAALILARARQRVLVIDAGLRRNRFAKAAHGFLGQDGRAPDAIAADGKAQLLAYPNVQWLDGNATRAEAAGVGFQVHVAEQSYHAERLILATGVVDELPEVDGLVERWGRSVFHCPYCHGYELNEGRIGVLAVGPLSMHHAIMLPNWGKVTFFLNETFAPDETERATLAAKGVIIESRRVRRIVETATVELTDGQRIAFDGLFTASRTHMASPLAEQLGCAFEDSPMGSFIRTNAMKETTVPGVFACGDAALMGSNVALAVGDGAQAGFSAHRSMLFPA